MNSIEPTSLVSHVEQQLLGALGTHTLPDAIAPSGVIVAAHPDDEVIGAAARLSRWSDSRVVHVTDGAPKDMRDARALGIGARGEYAALRRAERRHALELAKVSEQHIQDIGIVDREATGELVCALIGVDGIVTDETRQQGIFDWGRRKISVVCRMKYGFSFVEMVCQADTRAGLHACVDQVEVVVTNPKIDGQVAEWRKVVLDVPTGLSAFQSAIECWEDIRVAATVEEEVFIFAQAHQIQTAFKKVSMPIVGKIAFDSERERRA